MNDGFEPLSLRLGHLYPDQLNLYGDRGNILTLQRRCRERQIDLQIIGLGIGDALAPDEYDILFIGGGQDKEQAPVAQDFSEVKGDGLRAAVEDDVPVLAVCGGFQLLCHYYRPAYGPDLRGLGIFDAWTIHKGPRTPRCIGNIVIEWEKQTLVGFENHGGRTYLGTAKPLGKVLKGFGNNAEDQTEGAIYRHAYGTYLHGSLLPKNPHFADYLIQLALQHKYAKTNSAAPNEDVCSDSISGTDSLSPERIRDKSALSLSPLDDTLERAAHSSLLQRLGVPILAR
jgi:CobQ-like glutamine amidotransferase family enzyme